MKHVTSLATVLLCVYSICPSKPAQEEFIFAPTNYKVDFIDLHTYYDATMKIELDVDMGMTVWYKVPEKIEWEDYIIANTVREVPSTLEFFNPMTQEPIEWDVASDNQKSIEDHQRLLLIKAEKKLKEEFAKYKGRLYASITYTKLNFRNHKYTCKLFVLQDGEFVDFGGLLLNKGILHLGTGDWNDNQ